MQLGVSFFIYWLLLACWSPGWIGKRGSALRGAHKLPTKGNMDRKYSSAFSSFFSSQPSWLKEVVYEKLSLTSNSFRVKILIWWHDKGTQSLKEPVALDSAGRSSPPVCRGSGQPGNPSWGTGCYKALPVFASWWECRARWPFISVEFLFHALSIWNSAIGLKRNDCLHKQILQV